MPEAALPQATVLVVDDEPGILRLVAVALAGAGFSSILTLEDSREVSSALERQSVRVMILDLQMPHVSGIDILDDVRRNHPETAVVVLTANSELETAVRCMKLGAFDYLVKPVDMDRLVSTVRNAQKVNELRDQVTRLRRHLLNDSVDYEKAVSRMVTVNETMYGIFRWIDALPDSNPPVLVVGEKGTGRERLCRYIHEAASDKSPFVSVDVGKMTDEEFKASVFGYRKSLLEKAAEPARQLAYADAGGALCLRNIDGLGLDAQDGLCRLLAEGTYLPIHARTPVKSSARLFLTATTELDRRLADGKVSTELGRRLDEIRLDIPPLRDRTEDLPYLFDYFVSREASRLGRQRPAVSADLLRLLSSYAFPGNVGELEALITTAMNNLEVENAVLKADDFAAYLQPAYLREHEPEPAGGPLLQTFGHFPTVNETIDYLIEEALRATQGNKAAAASLLQITRQTINRRIRSKISRDGD